VKSNKPPFEKQLLTAAGRPGKCQCLWQWAPGPAVHAGPGAAHGAWIGHGGAPCGAVCAAPMGRAASLGQGADPPMGIGDGGASPSPPNRGRGRERVPDSGQIGDGDGGASPSPAKSGTGTGTVPDCRRVPSSHTLIIVGS
jgi:hypothetical protein